MPDLGAAAMVGACVYRHGADFPKSMARRLAGASLYLVLGLDTAFGLQPVARQAPPLYAPLPGAVGDLRGTGRRVGLGDSRGNMAAALGDPGCSAPHARTPRRRLPPQPFA